MTIGNIEQCLALIERLNNNDELKIFKDIFKYLSDKEYAIGLSKAGALTAENMIEINTRLKVYDELKNLEFILRNELKNKSLKSK